MNSPNTKPTTKAKRYDGTNFLRSIIRLHTRSPWNIYVNVPRDICGNTSENAYGTLDIADIPVLFVESIFLKPFY